MKKNLFVISLIKFYPKPLMNSKKQTDRLYSLDALRGFDMFWIMGGEDFFHALSKVFPCSTTIWIANQLSHVSWNGFRFYDLIFPLFLFIAGVSTPFSIGKQVEYQVSKQTIAYKILKRGMILIFLGIIYNNGLAIQAISHIRFPSVLGRIGLAYIFACLIYLYANKTWQMVWFVGLLIGYWLLLTLGAAPGYSAGDLTMQGNVVSWLDRSILPGRLHLGIHDPEGLFSTIPAIATGLLGIFAGNFLKESSTFSPTQKFIRLILSGFVFLIIGGIWNIYFPINKNLWTSSFMLYAGGCSLILLSIFYAVIDILEYKNWAFFFTVIGMNSILIYMSGGFIDWEYTASSICTWIGQLIGQQYHEVVLISVIILIKWLFLRFLYQQRIFLRV